MADNKYRVIGTKEKNTYVVDLIQSTCSCIQFYDKVSCKHLVACAYLADKLIMNVPLNIKFNIRYGQRKLVRKSYSNSEEDELSPSTTSPIPVPATSGVAVNRPMTRSQGNIVKGSYLIQTNSKVVKNRIKSNMQYSTLNQPDQPKKRGHPAKPTAALSYD